MAAQTVNAIFGPAEAIAAARCLTARSIAAGVTDGHPRACGWCPEPLADLSKLVDGWNSWAEYEPTGKYGGVSGRHEVRLFLELPRDEQRRQITAAQAFPAEPPEPPVQAPEPSVAVVEPPPDPPSPPAPEVPSWLVSRP